MGRHLQITINPEIVLPAYRPLTFDYSHPYEIYYGGRGSGKTHFVMQKLLFKGLKEKRNILLMNKTTAAVRDGVWKELRTAIEACGLEKYFTFNLTDHRAVCTLNGSEFRCMGLDVAEKIKGYAELSDVFLDELTNFTQEDYMLICGTVRSPIYNLPLQVIGSFNPVSKANWVYKYFGFDSGLKLDNTLILKTTYKDNPHADMDTYFANLKRVDPQRWKIEAMGDFVSLDKLVYNNWSIGQIPDTANMRMLVGLDWGFTNDPTALIVSFVDNEKLYIADEWYQTGMTNPMIAEEIKRRGLAKSIIIADSAEPKSVVELRQLGITGVRPSVKGPDSIVQGIQKLQQYQIVVSPMCVNTITELENYTWQKDKHSGEYINKPIDGYNHLLDALRYSLQTPLPPKPSTMNRNKLGL